MTARAPQVDEAVRRARAARGDTDDLFGPPSKGDQARMKRDAGKRDKGRQDAYEEGRKEARHDGGKPKPSPTHGRRRPPAPSRRHRAAARRIVRSGGAQISSGLELLGLTLAVVFLYLLLQSAPAVAGVFGGLARGLEWLSRPDRSIPYAGAGSTGQPGAKPGSGAQTIPLLPYPAFGPTLGSTPAFGPVPPIHFKL